LGDRIAAIAGDLADCESMLALKDLMVAQGSPNFDCRQDGAACDPASRASYIFNTTIAGIERADACLLVGTNPRAEAAIVNARLRKRWLQGGFRVAAIGPRVDLTYPVEWLGAGPETLPEFASGNHSWTETLKSAKHPMLIVGQGALRRKDGRAILASARQLAESTGMIRQDWNGYNVLQLAASRVGGLDLGFVPQEGGRDVRGILAGCEAGEIDLVYLLGADEIDGRRLGRSFVIYQGHHGDEGAQRADVILPGAAYTEKDATYVNTEGRVQLGRKAVFPPRDAREDWTIVRALSEAIGRKLPYDSLRDLRTRMIEVNPLFAHIDELVPAARKSFGREGPVDSAPFTYPIVDFYRTDAISRASPTMEACASAIRGKPDGIVPNKTGTDG